MVSTCVSDHSDPAIQNTCDIQQKPFCDHELGRNHPECKRCSAHSPAPNPPCFKYSLCRSPDCGGMESRVRECCSGAFNFSVTEKIEAATEDIDDLNEYIAESDKITETEEPLRKNFTDHCFESTLYSPRNSPPRGTLDTCLIFPFDSAGASSPTSLSGISGLGSIQPKSLQGEAVCTLPFCKRPSRINPDTIK